MKQTEDPNDQFPLDDNAIVEGTESSWTRQKNFNTQYPNYQPKIFHFTDAIVWRCNGCRGVTENFFAYYSVTGANLKHNSYLYFLTYLTISLQNLHQKQSHDAENIHHIHISLFFTTYHKYVFSVSSCVPVWLCPNHQSPNRPYCRPVRRCLAGSACLRTACPQRSDQCPLCPNPTVPL